MSLDIPERVAVVILIPDRLEAAALGPYLPRHNVADCLCRGFFRDANLVPCSLAAIGQFSQHVHMHAANTYNEKAMISLVESVDETAADGFTKL